MGESLSQAAMREAVEETGLPFTEAPRELGHTFVFVSKWGGEMEEHGFALEAPRGADEVQLDPHEHVDYRWVQASEAERWLKHSSSVEGLQKLIQLVSWVLVFLAFLNDLPQARAAQEAKVISETAEVHQLPNEESPPLGSLAKNAAIRISSGTVRDTRGAYWYKVRMPDGKLGYLRANDVQASQFERELRVAGVDSAHDAQEERDFGERGWLINIRTLGIAGYEVNSKSFEPGGEAEVSFSLFPSARGYDQRKVSLGVAIQTMTIEDVIAASLIYRAQVEGRWEPEFRLRLGEGITSGSFVAGADLGARYPLSTEPGSHYDAYIEAGGLGSYSYVAPVHFWLSAGLGCHF